MSLLLLAGIHILYSSRDMLLFVLPKNEQMPLIRTNATNMLAELYICTLYSSYKKQSTIEYVIVNSQMLTDSIIKLIQG